MKLEKNKYFQYERVTEKISGYTTTYNCVNLGIPFQQSIKSMLGFCDEIVVLDGESDDGTYEVLEKMAEEDERIQVYQNLFDMEEPSIDGSQKAYARALCQYDYLVQFDCDEIAHEQDYEKWKNLTKRFPMNVDLIHLPIIELWGDPYHMTSRRHCWKWRISRNKPEITHAINKHARVTSEETGKVYARQGMSDGCEYVNVMNFEFIPHIGFYSQNPEIENARLSDPQRYADICNMVFSKLPSMWHTSWCHLPTKLNQLKPGGMWDKLWSLLYQQDAQNRYPDVDFSDQEQVEKLIKVLYDEGAEAGDQVKGKFELKMKPPKLLMEWWDQK